MDTKDILNAAAYPAVIDNVRRKSQPLYDTVTVAAGTTDYYFFTTDPGNIFLRNIKLPLAGSQVFFVEGISAILSTPITSTALARALCNLLQLAFLQITVNGRIQCKLPLLDVLRYQTTLNEDATPEILRSNYRKVIRPMPYPILLNSTSSVEVKLVMGTTEATSFDTGTIKLVFHGIQLDKLDPFYYDELKGNQFQKVSQTYYNTQSITTGNQTTYNFFTTPNQNPRNFSQSFPLSDITRFDIQEIEVFVGQPDVAIQPSTIYDSRLQNNLVILVDNVEFYNSNLQDKLSVLASFGGNITDSAAATTAYVNVMDMRESHVLKVPLVLPAQSNINIAITQPASSLPITGNITLALRGTETRRVA